ncbi:MAG TPA: NAD-dependent epimerase/dehydratase family protein [Candidatus Nanoarchaeia archaeon]|nr:NAD-dependent epimerase/dehydratase family protein [Candidatus Nanoarchaeia archaeon]
MKCLVTGGTGFVGSNLALHLIKEGHDVIIAGHDAEQKLPNFNGKILRPSFIGIDWDAIGKVDVVFHQAAITDTLVLDEKEMMRVNLHSSQELFKKVVENGCKKIVYASSTAVYGDAPAPYKEDGAMNPLNPYGKSKKLLDEFAMKFAKEHPDVKIVGLRYCNVYGPRENHKGKMASMIYQLAQQMIRGNPRIFKYGEQKRDYIYVEDVVAANILASKAKESCVVNCGYGKATTFNELIEILNSVMGLKRKPEYIDNPYADRYQDYTECDMSLAKKKIGFVPKNDPATGIKKYYESGWLVK